MDCEAEEGVEGWRAESGLHRDYGGRNALDALDALLWRNEEWRDEC